MRISTRLRLASTLPGMIFIIIGVAIVISFFVTTSALEKGNTTRLIRNSLTNIGNFADSYMEESGERAKIQFTAEYVLIDKLLANLHSQNIKQQQIISSLETDVISLNNMFLALVSINEHFEPEINKELRLRKQQSLQAQIKLLIREIDIGASLLRNLADIDVRNTILLTFAIIVCILILSVVPLSVILQRMRSTIASSLTELRQGAEVIGSGNLDHRIVLTTNDEFEDLGQSFNNMAERLSLTTSSKDILEQEVKERKRAELRLKESEEKYFALFHSNPQWLHISTPEEGRYVEVNDVVKEITGYDRDEVVGRTSKELGLWADYEERSRLVKVAEEQGGFRDQEVIFVKKNGEHVSLLWSVATIEIMGTAYFINSIADITELKHAQEEKIKLETQLLQIGKIEAIATLAGGIAHEFNNALMGVMGNIEILKWDFREDERIVKYFEGMEESCHRMSRLTDQLLAYAEGGKYQGRELKLDAFIIETLPILQHDRSPEVRVETRFQKDISYITADHTQMQMVLSAILANSHEAIEDAGLIKIIAENKDVDEDFTKQHPGFKPGSYVCLTIKDDGKGMDEETKDAIFEPFFTTKFQGRGMGMAAVYGIIKNHDGAITVDSEPSKGTVVRIYLPAVQAKEEPKAVKQPKAEIAMGQGSILVIEDDEPLVDLLRQILGRLGYDVLLARSGKEAVELARTFDGRIDLALLDLKLPDMDGQSVFPLIMAARPDLKVIVCSGYSVDGPARAILDAGAEGFIQKPFSIAPFAEKLKEVLGGK
jgi:PAS domain S-box-containing protein